MEVILKETIDTLGREGDIVTVKAGYGRNYLLPQQKAVIANATNVAIFEKNQAEIQARIKEEIKAAEAIAKKLAGTTLIIAMLTGNEERLFGSVTSSDIAAKLEEDTKVAIDKKNILLPDPIKELGENSVTIKVGFQTTVEITVSVVPLVETAVA
ncbi:LSU ribosomal protein L9P [Desulfocapsa sulfexigens DSM 10523]|uniref:Large ribosomal subunit protein bL9 n=1 Tax=Desulfocapsa sulfexigens (strain DSM 10523 / SB164P1) TaxID=1167006 RepID=M1PCJ0_DESSD|nr:50S ribosomal protein L9 [Desulfocapsa sulfexigens]AGF79332.1 LSU ribosomal protein L9P [Desulfocapsa sulfexigens DSM 10523]